MIEERNIYLQENTDDIANGFYIRDLSTSISKLKDLRVSRSLKNFEKFLLRSVNTQEKTLSFKTN